MSNENIHKNHRQRLKKQFMYSYGEEMNDYAFLEYFLFFAIPQGDTNPLAHRLIDTFGSFYKVFEADVDELLKVEGVGEHTVHLIKMMIPFTKRYFLSKSNVKFYADDYDAIKEYIPLLYVGVENEKTMIMNFNARKEFINYHWLSDGDDESVATTNEKIMSYIIKDNAKYSLLVHNHPSGVVVPSKSDISSFLKIRQIAKTIGNDVFNGAVCYGDKVKFYSEHEFFGAFFEKSEF